MSKYSSATQDAVAANGRFQAEQHKRALPQPVPLFAPQPGRPGQMVAVKYVGNAKVVVRGPSTGVRYTFSANGQAQSVDVKDAAVLLRTSYFRKT